MSLGLRDLGRCYDTASLHLQGWAPCLPLAGAANACCSMPSAHLLVHMCSCIRTCMQTQILPNLPCRTVAKARTGHA